MVITGSMDPKLSTFQTKGIHTNRLYTPGSAAIEWKKSRSQKASFLVLQRTSEPSEQVLHFVLHCCILLVHGVLPIRLHLASIFTCHTTDHRTDSHLQHPHLQLGVDGVKWSGVGAARPPGAPTRSWSGG